eukprot:4466707-Pleurochrysis_carterae.AAC.1
MLGRVRRPGCATRTCKILVKEKKRTSVCVFLILLRKWDLCTRLCHTEARIVDTRLCFWIGARPRVNVRGDSARRMRGRGRVSAGGWACRGVYMLGRVRA